MDQVFEFIEIKEVHGKLKLYLKNSGYYLATFNYSADAVKAATVADGAIWARQNEHLVEPNN